MPELLPVSRAHLWAVAAVTATTAAFGWVQNRGALIGGPISKAKVLWLNFTLIMFFVLPLFLWQNVRLEPAVSALFGTVFFLFVARAVAEIYLIYVTIGWKCAYGIAHDWLVIVLVAALRLRLPETAGEADVRAVGLASFLQGALAVESYMAWAFSRVASPAEGIYFASDDEKFRGINQATWAAVAAGHALLGAWLWLSRGDFSL